MHFGYFEVLVDDLRVSAADTLRGSPEARTTGGAKPRTGVCWGGSPGPSPSAGTGTLHRSSVRTYVDKGKD